HREAVQAKFLIRNKTMLIQIIGAVLEVDAVELRLPLLAVCFNLESLHQTFDLFGNIIAGMIAYLLMNLVDEFVFIYLAIQVEQGLLQTHQGMLCEEAFAEGSLQNFAFVIHPGWTF